MDIKARNKEVKKRLAAVFGLRNVSVVNGKGTAYGWCNVYITAGNRLDSTSEPYTQRERDLLNGISKKARELIKGIEFYNYTDDMNMENDELIIQVSFA